MTRRKLLESEGIVFTGGRADPAQRITAAELAGLLGMDTGDLPGARTPGTAQPDRTPPPAASSWTSSPTPIPTA